MNSYVVRSNEYLMDLIQEERICVSMYDEIEFGCAVYYLKEDKVIIIGHDTSAEVNGFLFPSKESYNSFKNQHKKLPRINEINYTNLEEVVIDTLTNDYSKLELNEFLNNPQKIDIENTLLKNGVIAYLFIDELENRNFKIEKKVEYSYFNTYDKRYVLINGNKIDLIDVGTFIINYRNKYGDFDVNQAVELLNQYYSSFGW